MSVVDLEGLPVLNAHISDFSSVDGNFGVSLVVVEELGELDFDVLLRLLLMDPHR